MSATFGIPPLTGPVASSAVPVTSSDVATPADGSGQMEHGRYRLIAKLGEGGMGITDRAWDTQSGVPVVVKMPRREERHDSAMMHRFSREIEAMRAVPHKNIVPITDSGHDAGCPFVVMRFLPGGSLAELFATRGVPRHIRSDNGPEFIAKALRRWLGQVGVEALYIEPRSPWENGYAESFHGRVRDKFLAMEIFEGVRDARLLTAQWRDEYNTQRPHSSLGYQTPERFAAARAGWREAPCS